MEDYHSKGCHLNLNPYIPKYNLAHKGFCQIRGEKIQADVMH